MTQAEKLKAYDEKRATMFGSSILTDGNKDYYGECFEKVGRRNVWRFKQPNSQGALVSCFMYVTDLNRCLESKALTVYAK